MYDMIYDWTKFYYPQIAIAELIVVLCLGIILSLLLIRRCRKWIFALGLSCYIFFVIILTLGTRERRGYSIVITKIHWQNILWMFQDGVLPDWEDICNIFLFLPIGVFLYNLAAGKLHWYGCILLGACLSAFIEMMQYIFRCGYCDINDFIHNVIGTACGYFMGILVHAVVDNRLEGS